MIRVFISHKREDSTVARQIALRIEGSAYCRAYLDVLDSQLTMGGDDLGEYFRQKLSECTHLMAVISVVTAQSWWVPFEIGIATEKQYPLSTFASGSISLPDYLRKWPSLHSHDDVDKYLQTAINVGNRVLKKSILMEDMRTASLSERTSYARTFHADLKRALGQE